MNAHVIHDHLLGCIDCQAIDAHVATIEQGILECQTRILALERELAEAKRKRDELDAAFGEAREDARHAIERWQAITKDRDRTDMALTVMTRNRDAIAEDRDEAHAAIRLLGQAMAMYDNGGFVGDNIDRWFNQFIFHAPVIRRAMGEGK